MRKSDPGTTVCFNLDPDGSAIPVQVFESMNLPDQWSRLDDFEGSDLSVELQTQHDPSFRVTGGAGWSMFHRTGCKRRPATGLPGLEC